MGITLYSNDGDEYLKCDSVIDFDNGAIIETADALSEKADSDLDYARRAYEFVRDRISHSADIGEDRITISASEVLSYGHGICFAKSHLLAALLRYKSIPAGFCYQKLILDDESAPFLVYHGLNGVYLEECDKWIRLDARGNRNGIDAQFEIDEEQLAYPIRAEKGEEDGLIIYPSPDAKVLDQLKASQTRSKLWDNLPTELKYNSKHQVSMA